MYTIKCDGYPLLDLRDDKEELTVVNPKCKLEVNTVGEASFNIYKKHPYYGKLKKLKSIFEIADEIGVIFRGRMTNDSLDFYNGKAVDLEGAMAFFNDSYIDPFNFPEDFADDEGYTSSTNVIKFFLGWVISKHNSQVDDFQQFKLGNVTVTDPNNYLSRSSTEITSSWEILKSKLFDSALGGYLCIRYEEDGNYIDYLSDFELTNTQDINFGENLLDFVHKSDAQETYSCIIPIGAEIEETVSEADDSGETTIVKKRLTIESIADGEITDDIVKVGKRLYSKSARESMGMICAPVSDTTWEDVTEVQNLLTKSVEYLSGTAIKLTDTVEITAADLHFTDEEIRSFRIYRKINVNSAPHGIEATFQLTKLEIDLLNPQNTKITVGETKLTLIDQNNKEQSDNIIKIEQAIKDIEENRSETTEIRNQVITQRTEIINTCTEIILAASEQYVETGEYDEFKQTVEAQMTIISDQISMNFTETTTQIENVNGDLQETNTMLSKYFEFTIDGLVIKSGESNISLHIDNDIIMFKRNGVMFGWWDGTDFHTGNIVVEVNERAQFGNFAFVPRSDGSLSFLKVDNEILTNKLLTISVTYDGGDVSVGTTLEELTGITVTAVYSDGSTEEVTDYTLSGMIQEGTNTITVTYQGKTVRFSVVGLAVKPTSISVTYTGGGVTAGTSLTDLTGITVTATYPDGSTSNVTSYELSGEILEGINTITVTFEGLTDTFTVQGVLESGGEVTSGFVMRSGTTTSPIIETGLSSIKQFILNATNINSTGLIDLSYNAELGTIYTYCSSWGQYVKTGSMSNGSNYVSVDGGSLEWTGTSSNTQMQTGTEYKWVAIGEE